MAAERDPLSEAVIGLAIEVHRELGPGLLAPIHHAQMLTYLRLSGLRLGLLMNFNMPVLKDGLKRIAL